MKYTLYQTIDSHISFTRKSEENIFDLFLEQNLTSVSTFLKEHYHQKIVKIVYTNSNQTKSEAIIYIIRGRRRKEFD